MKKLIALTLAVMLLIGMLPLAVGAATGLESKLLGEWTFDDQTTGTATLYNNADVATGTYVDGVSGKALMLSTKGTDEKYWLDIPYSTFGDHKNSFTIALWYNSTGHNESGEQSELFTLYNSTADKQLWYGIRTNGHKDADTFKWNGAHGYANVIGGYKENEWVHLVYCVDEVDGQTKISAFVNGVAVEVDQGGNWTDSLMTQMGMDKFTIGGKNPYKGGHTPNCLFYGSVDEVQLYAGALSAEEASRVYESYTNPPAAAGTLLGEWNFNEENTGTATLYNDATATTGTYVDGVSGKALKLSTKDSGEKFWLDIPYSTFGGNKNSFTLSLWYNSTGHNESGEQSELFTLYNSTADKQLWYGIRTNGHKDADTFKWNGAHGYANVIGGYKENEWVHLVYCVDVVDGQTKISAFVNGAAVEVDQGGNWADSLMTQMGMDKFTIGGKNPYKGGESPKVSFYGFVDEVKLYAGALNADQAKAIYDAEAPKAPACDHASDKLTWDHDENQHWQNCSCGEYTTDKTAHDGNATCVCGYTKPVDEPSKTGDASMLIAAMIVAVASATGIVAIIRKREV